MPKPFGGPWTLVKLAVLRNYLQAYGLALKSQRWFTLMYIDAFAGDGQVELPTGQKVPGSAAIALESNAFQRYLFIEQNPEDAPRLDIMCDRYRQADPSKIIEVQQGDSNQNLEVTLRDLDWKHTRAVAFLDPFGMELAWETLGHIARTHAIDVWYWFPLSGLYRQAARNSDAIDEAKARSLDHLLGDGVWRDLYDTEQLRLWGPPLRLRAPGVDRVETFVVERLRSIFAGVAKSKRLPVGESPRYVLFFAVSNPDPKAQGLAMRIAGHILDHL